ncbi:hypothetical protein J6590_092633 [Homalodisca vitripennis]|nr:hypothetical protein J6590_092633 [Homalodisca vitripennis]
MDLKEKRGMNINTPQRAILSKTTKLVSQHRNALNCSLGISDVEKIWEFDKTSLFFVNDYFWIPLDEQDSRFQESSLQQHHSSDAARNRNVGWC